MSHEHDDVKTSLNPGDPAEQERVAKLVNSFISMMDIGNIEKLDLEYGDLRISLRARSEKLDRASTDHSSVQSSAATGDSAAEPDGPVTHTITAPMIGTFYAAPAPNEDPFIAPGDSIHDGQTIGIIEAMKIMNEIAADCDGEVVEIIAADGQTVEYGSPLVVVRPRVS